MKKLILLFTLIFSGFVFGQVKDTIIDGKKTEIYYSIDRDAEFPEGFEVFKKTKPDACVVDLFMEEHDSGFVLCYRIKNDEHGKKIPVFILTSATYDTGFKFGASTSEEREWIKADALIHKPVIIEEFVEKLEAFYELKK